MARQKILVLFRKDWLFFKMSYIKIKQKDIHNIYIYIYIYILYIYIYKFIYTIYITVFERKHTWMLS